MRRLFKYIFPKNFSGDTIVEVLIAVTVAGFAMGSCYTIANKSVQKAISARERNEAVNALQNQITALKLRERLDPANFNKVFGAPTGFTGPGSGQNYCLDETATSPSNSTWGPISNTVTDTNVGKVDAGNPGYKPQCVKNSLYYVNIAATVPTSSQTDLAPTTFKLTAYWSAIGTGDVNQAVIYYRVSSLADNSPPATITLDLTDCSAVWQALSDGASLSPTAPAGSYIFNSVDGNGTIPPGGIHQSGNNFTVSGGNSIHVDCSPGTIDWNFSTKLGNFTLPPVVINVSNASNFTCKVPPTTYTIDRTSGAVITPAGGTSPDECTAPGP